MKEGDIVYSVGFGFFNDLQQSSVHKGYITRIVYLDGKQLFIQHTARTYGGHSGGALFNENGFFIGLLFKNQILNLELTDKSAVHHPFG